MLIGMVFGGLAGVMCRIKPVAVCDVRMVRRFLVIAGFMVLGSFAMMNRCLFVMFCCLLVMLGTFVGFHERSPIPARARVDGIESSEHAKPRAPPDLG
jgi:hypothetical protein